MEESYRLRLEAEVEALEKKMAAGGPLLLGNLGMLWHAKQHLGAGHQSGSTERATSMQPRGSRLGCIFEHSARCFSFVAEAASKRGRGHGGKAKPEQLAGATGEHLAAARAEAAEAAAKAEQLQEEVEGLQQQLADVQAQAEQQLVGAAEHAAGLAAELAEAQHRVADAAASLSAEQQRSAALEAELAAAQQAGQAELGAAMQQVGALQEELATAQQAAAQAQAELAAANEQVARVHAERAAAQQQAEELGAQVTVAQQQVAELGAELAAWQHKAADLDAELAAARKAADSSHRRASEKFEAQLQEAVTQLEVGCAAQPCPSRPGVLPGAMHSLRFWTRHTTYCMHPSASAGALPCQANKGMELEMAEEQFERLRKENLALKARLQAALAALAACGSPVAGPAALAMRMAQVGGVGGGGRDPARLLHNSTRTSALC